MLSLPTVLQVTVFSNQDMEFQYYLCQGLCLRNSLDQILQLMQEIWILIPEKMKKCIRYNVYIVKKMAWLVFGV